MPPSESGARPVRELPMRVEAAEPEEEESEPSSPGYIEEGASVRANTRESGRAASMARMIQRQKHRAKFLASQSVSQAEAMRIASKIGVAFLQSAVASMSESVEEDEPRMVTPPREKRRQVHGWRSYDRGIPRSRDGRGPLFRAPHSRREVGRFGRGDAGFVGLETRTKVQGKARFPRTIITTLDPVTVEVELDSQVRRSANAALEKDSIEFQQQASTQTGEKALQHETLMQYPVASGPVAQPRFSEVRSQATALAQTQQQLEQKASEAALNLQRAKEHMRALETQRVAESSGVNLPFLKTLGKLFSKKGKKGKKKGKKGKKVPPDPRKLEDCCGCRFVWSQVEMDIGSARYIEDVQASFEHNCMDAQKSSIFYPVCEDMYDDMYALTDDYMSNKFSVSTMCQRGKFCK